MLRRTIVSLLCAALLFTELPAEPPTYDISGRSPAGSALRSLILPGWGQSHNGQEFKGYVIGGTVLLTAAGSYLLYTKANNTYSDYEKLGLKNGPLYDDYQTQSNQAMVASVICAGLWAWGIIDAYVYAREPAAGPESRTGLSFACARNRPGVFYTKKF